MRRFTELDSLGPTQFLASRNPGCIQGSDLGKTPVILDNCLPERSPCSELFHPQGTTQLPSPPLQLGAFPLSIHFAKHQDRFLHHIGLHFDNSHLELLRSIPGDNSDPWPADAPLQQVVLESIRKEGSPIAFGVGLSGHGHWSLACEVLSGDTPGFQLDFACKTSSPPHSLSSCYSVVQHAGDANTTESEVLPRISATETCCRIPTSTMVSDSSVRGLTVRGFLVVQVQRGQLEYHSDHETLWIRPAELLDRAGTYRWCYSIQWEPS